MVENSALSRCSSTENAFVCKLYSLSLEKSSNVSIYEKNSTVNLFFAEDLPRRLLDQAFANLKYC